eukprot:3941401-Rhodomonas_salina.1
MPCWYWIQSTDGTAVCTRRRGSTTSASGSAPSPISSITCPPSVPPTRAARHRYRESAAIYGGSAAIYGVFSAICGIVAAIRADGAAIRAD